MMSGCGVHTKRQRRNGEIGQKVEVAELVQLALHELRVQMTLTHDARVPFTTEANQVVVLNTSSQQTTNSMNRKNVVVQCA